MWEFQNGQWIYNTAHIGEAVTFLDTTLFLCGQMVGSYCQSPNYNYAYHLRLATKMELVCHEEAHALGLNHAQTTNSCMSNDSLCDQGNPLAHDQICVSYLYSEAASRIDQEHNHNDGSHIPDFALLNETLVARKIRSADAVALAQAAKPWLYYGKKGVRVVEVDSRPTGLPKRNVIYVSQSLPASTGLSVLFNPFSPLSALRGV
jgi:hypothetical protein